MTEPKNILVVDDDVHFAQVMSRSLSKRGHHCDTAADSITAINAVKANHYDWISLDLRLGEESGLVLLPNLRACNPEARIVVLTGFASIPTAVEAVQQGAHNYLHKPATLQELLNAFDGTHHTPAPINDKPMSIERVEWEHIQRVLQEYNGNISSTARALGMHRRTLQRKLQKHPVRN